MMQQLLPPVPIGRGIGPLKQKLALNNIAKEAINKAQKNNLTESLALLDNGFSTSPSLMAETLSKNISQLPTNEKQLIFENFRNMQLNKTLVSIAESVHGKIKEVKDLSKPSLDFYMEKLFSIAKENNFNLNRLIKR